MPIQQLAPKSPGRNPISSDAGPIPLAMSLPQRGWYSPPALVDDAMREIFKRVPPDDPRSLVRAAAVCTSWHGILSDADFAREYRAFHGAPPVLGFLHNTRHKRSWEKGRIRHYRKEYVVSNFVSIASFRTPACRERRHWRVLDSRHGLVLFHTPKRDEDFAICDLVTGDGWRVKADPDCADIIWNGWSDDDDNEYEQENEGVTWNAAVLCAKDGCDHIYCHGGPFLVALVGSDEEQRMTFAAVYSSETRKWSDIVSIEEPNAIETTGHSAVVGNKVYFPCEETYSLVEYDMAGQKLSVIALAEEEDDDLPWLDLMGVEDGMLLLATVMNFRLCLWSMEAGPSKTAVWTRHRVIDLVPLLPASALIGVSVVGFAEGVGVIFLNTKAGLYTVELSSGRSKKLHGETSFEEVMPYMSFYTRADKPKLSSHLFSYTRMLQKKGESTAA
ncbi:hypothetical protein CFC21_058808 [Triticum aestivum]|uniref:Uncharacterized protein n=3 Tax=Triticum aestivum TaxID=4565 RepID=A0A3B6ITE2_WHEAT|nr:uncharacterized protein LOC123093302 isoform X1 [Triticum aestivum]KAF7050439.1 hypothetical protein CFC21_058808 [Triticum aestivum]